MSHFLSVLRPAAAAASLCVLPALACAQPTSELDAYVEKILATHKLPGAAIAVVKDGQVVVAKGYGLSNVEASTKATADTVYQLASVTKQFTAAAALMLVEDGKLSLDAKVTELLPGLPAAWSPVTVRHLLSHTSGIKSYTEVFGARKTPEDKVFTKDEIIALVADAPLQFAPGERFAYCNTGYYLLGLVIEKASGKKYADFLAERIFKPLAMTSTGLDDYADVRPQRARGYSLEGGASKPAPHTHPSQPFAAGALVSTVVDMAKWDAALAGRKLLKPASYDALWTPFTFNDGKKSGYAFGWQVDPYRTRPRQAHGGGISGFSTFVARYPEEKVTVIALVNQGGPGGGMLANGIADLYVPGLKELAPKPITDADPDTTVFLKKVIAAAAGGSAEPDWFTPEFRSFMFPDRIKQGPQMFGRFGPLQAFELMEDATRDGRRVRAYRATFGTTAVRTTFTLAPDGKIAGLGVQPDN
jgi:CubicO group peptidase (beta-lactamase class C family)